MTPAALDITLAIILLLSALVAYFRGIIREAFTIVALIIATSATYFGGEHMIPAFNKWLHVDERSEQAAAAVSKSAAAHDQIQTAFNVKDHLFMGVLSYDKLAIICAYASVFLFFYLVMSLVGFFIARAVAEAGLGVFDRILGAGFGLLRGALVLILCFMPISFMIDHDKFPDWAKNSVSVPLLEQSVAYIDEKVDIKKLIADSGHKVLDTVAKHQKAQPQKPEPAPVRNSEIAPASGGNDGEILGDERAAQPR